MSLAIANLTSNSDASTATVYTTASITPSARSVVLISVEGRAGTPLTPTISGLGVTWTELASLLNPNVAHRLSVFAATVGPSPATGTITITYPGTMTGCTWIVDNATPGFVIRNVVSGTATGTTVPTAFGSFLHATNSMAYAAVQRASTAATITARAGWTEIVEQAGAGNAALLETQYKAGSDTDCDATASIGGSELAIVGLEIVLSGVHYKQHAIGSTDHTGLSSNTYTQTYSTADRTHDNPTASALTVSDGAGTNDNTIGAITADASVIAAVQEIADEINKLVADVADVKQLVNGVIDDLQSMGLVG